MAGNKSTLRVCQGLRDKYVRSIMLKTSIFYTTREMHGPARLPQMRNVFNSVSRGSRCTKKIELQHSAQ